MIASSKKNGFWGHVREFIVLILIVFVVRTFFFGLYQVPTGSMETTMLVGDRFFADKFSYLFVKPQRGHIISLNNPLFQYSDNTLMRLYQEYVWGPINLTKRIIGLPGEHVKGVIEDGKPALYINGKKLDEPYLNKYPLIAVWKDDFTKLLREVNQEIIQLKSQSQLDPSQLNQYFNSKMANNLLWRSYDPNYSYEKQPFYYIKESLVVKHDGQPQLRMPYTPMENLGAAIQPQEGVNFYNGSDEFDIHLGPNEYWLMGDNRQNSGDSRVFGPVDGRLIHGRIIFRIWSLDSTEDWWIIDLLKHPIDFWSRVRWNRFCQWVY